MTVQEFHDRAIEWLRAEHHMRTDVIAGVRLEGEPRVRGFFARGTGVTRWAMIGLYVVTFGIIISMTNLPAFDAESRALAQTIGYVVIAVGCGFWVFAEITRRRDRERGVVDLRALEADPPTPESIAKLHDDARGGAAWIVAEGEIDRAVLAAASKRGVRCFVLDGERFREAQAKPA